MLHTKYLHPQVRAQPAGMLTGPGRTGSHGPLGRGRRDDGDNPLLLARTSGMSVNLFIAGATVLSALPDNSECSDAF